MLTENQALVSLIIKIVLVVVALGGLYFAHKHSKNQPKS